MSAQPSMLPGRASSGSARRARPINPGWLRVIHWLNVVAVVVMVMSGWQIYNASPLFEFRFPKSITLGGWLAGALMWHYAAMWLLLANGLAYVVLNVVTGRARMRFWPLRPRDVWRDLRAALRGRLAHDDLSHYNAVQKAAYVFVVVDLAVLVLSGLAIWKPVQFAPLCALLGGYEAARHVHFFAMAGLVGFVVVHVLMVALVPRSLRAMTIGR